MKRQYFHKYNLQNQILHLKDGNEYKKSGEVTIEPCWTHLSVLETYAFLLSKSYAVYDLYLNWLANYIVNFDKGYNPFPLTLLQLTVYAKPGDWTLSS